MVKSSCRYKDIKDCKDNNYADIDVKSFCFYPQTSVDVVCIHRQFF